MTDKEIESFVESGILRDLEEKKLGSSIFVPPELINMSISLNPHCKIKKIMEEVI